MGKKTNFKTYLVMAVILLWICPAVSKPLGMTLGQQITSVETFFDDGGEPIYYVVYLQPSGFVIVPAEDLR